MFELIKFLKGDKIFFKGEKYPYKVRARGKRFLVCTKPFNILHTVLYCIVDLEKEVRGPENLIFGFGAETDKDCSEMIERLEGREKTYISHRRMVPLEIVRVVRRDE
jgi:hypothetical protein